MHKKVLIALDYNPTSEKVARLGFSFAQAMNADVMLLHVLYEENYYTNTNYSSMWGFEGEMSYNLIDGIELKQYAVNYLDKIKKHLGDENIQTIVDIGDSAAVILETAKTNNVDYIVMGSHSQKWIESLLLGSVTNSVLKHTTLPLFIIPSKEEEDK